MFENINSLKELAQMPQWTAEKPLRVAIGFTYLGPKFMKENGLKYVTFSTADGALEAAPAAVLVASRKALIQRKGALDITQEILERLEARFEGCWSAGIIWTAGVHDCGKLSWEKKRLILFQSTPAVQIMLADSVFSWPLPPHYPSCLQ